MREPARGYSFEFFPPKTEVGMKRLRKVVGALAPLEPSFVSVTFGAGGSTREGSFQTCSDILANSPLEVTPHLSCIGSNRSQLQEQLECYRTVGVKRVMALRGDFPEDEQPSDDQAFRYANELVDFIHAFGGFHISVACYPEFHPEAPDPQTDLANFARKVRAGADEAISQYFYTNDAYYSFVDAAQKLGVEIPIVPGIMPMTDYDQVKRFSGFCGADIPSWIRKRMESFADDKASQRELGIELASRQAEDLLRNGAPGLHFYTLNRSAPTLRIWENLGLTRPEVPEPVSPRASN